MHKCISINFSLSLSMYDTANSCCRRKLSLHQQHNYVSILTNDPEPHSACHRIMLTSSGKFRLLSVSTEFATPSLKKGEMISRSWYSPSTYHQQRERDRAREKALSSFPVPSLLILSEENIFCALNVYSWNSKWILRRGKIDFQYSSMASRYHMRFRLPSHVYQYLRAFQIESFHRLLRLALIQIRFECNNAFSYISIVRSLCERMSVPRGRQKGFTSYWTLRPICLLEKIGYIWWNNVNIQTFFVCVAWNHFGFCTDIDNDIR